MNTQLAEIAEKIKDKDPVEALKYFADQYPGLDYFFYQFWLGRPGFNRFDFQK